VEGSALAYSIVAQPSHGTLSGSAPDVTYTPAAGYSGADSFTFQANDGQADSNVATVSITVNADGNVPPVANSQTVTTTKGTPVDITLTASDADGDPLTYVVVTQPTYGSLSGTAPNLVYTPMPKFTGSDSFTFRANDGQSNSNTATVWITVKPGQGGGGGGRPRGAQEPLLVERNVFRPGSGEQAAFDIGADEGATATVTVRDQDGRLVNDFLQEVSPGSSRIAWDGLTNSGQRAESGTYYVYVECGGRKIKQRMVLIR
jgi:hypothetical protein